MEKTVSRTGQIMRPAEDAIEGGQAFEVDRGEQRLNYREQPRNQGFVDWLLACPVKGFFAPIESEDVGSGKL